MSRNILKQVLKTDYPDVPKEDPDWRIPVGSVISVSVYVNDIGWRKKRYKVVKYYPHIVQCVDKFGQYRCFTNWEFYKRQKGRIDKIKGRGSHLGSEEKEG